MCVCRSPLFLALLERREIDSRCCIRAEWWIRERGKTKIYWKSVDSKKLDWRRNSGAKVETRRKRLVRGVPSNIDGRNWTYGTTIDVRRRKTVLLRRREFSLPWEGSISPSEFLEFYRPETINIYTEWYVILAGARGVVQRATLFGEKTLAKTRCERASARARVCVRETFPSKRHHVGILSSRAQFLRSTGWIGRTVTTDGSTYSFPAYDRQQ